MSRFLQEFFWSPSEIVDWVRAETSSLRLWTVLWHPGRRAQAIDARELRTDILYDRTEDSVQLFLGSTDISNPVWAAHSKALEFQRSYAVQLVPSLVAPDDETLLQGRLAILDPRRYDDPEKAMKLATLFRALCNDLKRDSDRTRIIEQPLSTGGRRKWKDILIGKSVPGPDIKYLKQFSKGEVIFQIAPASQKDSG